METSIQKEERVFSAAREIADPAERAALLDRECDGDEALRAAVEESLAACGDADEFFKRSGKTLVLSGEAIQLSSALDELEADAVGTIIGLLAAGRTEAEILAAYPYLEAEDLREALAYAAWRVEETEVLLADR